MAVIKIGANIQEVRQGVGKIYTLFSNLESSVNRIQIGKDLIKQVDALAQSLSKTTINKDLTAQLKVLAKYYKELVAAGQKASEVVQKQDQAQAKAVVSVDTLRKSVSNLIGSLKTLQSQYASGTFTDATNGNKEYSTSLQEILTELDTYSKKIKNKEELDSTELKRVKELRQQYQRLAAEVAKAKGVTGTKAAASDPFYPKAIDQVTALKARISSLTATMQAQSRYYAKGTFDPYISELQQAAVQVETLNQAAQTGNGLTQEQMTALEQLRTKVNQTNAAFKEAAATNKNYHGTLRDMITGFLKFQVSAMLVMKPLQMIRDAWSSINETLVETENRVVELRRVVGDMANASELYDLAQKYGQTFENVSEATLNFARRGMSWNESLKATEAALLAINVAELDVGQATDGLGAIMAQFGIEASNLTNVVDMLNKTADNFPVTTSKILAALQRVGSTASTANLSLEETIGLITTLSKATNRSGENIGTALNSILNIAQKSSTLDTFSKLGDSVKSVVEQYRGGGTSILEVLRAVSEQVQKLDTNQIFDTAEFAELNEQLKEQMGEDFEMLSEIYGTAGTYRRNYFIALLNDLDTVQEVQDEIANAQGYSQKENEQYLDTYTAKLNSLQAKWQDIANDEQGLLALKKDLIDLGSGVLDIIQALGGLKSALIAISLVVGTIVATTKGAAIVSMLTRIGTLLKSLTIDAIPNAIGAWKSFARGISSAGTAMQASLPLLTAVVIAINAITSAIQRNKEAREEAEREKYDNETNAIKSANDETEAVKKSTQAIIEYKEQVEELRKILDDSTSSENDKVSAQNQLLSMQNKLIESNNAYADSLNLTNGNLAEQLGLLDKLTDEQLRQQAQNFLTNNNAKISIAQNRLDSVSSNSTSTFLSGVGNDRHQFRDIINNAISGAGIGDLASLIEDNEYGYLHSYWKGVVESEDFWSGLGNLLNPFDDLWEDNGKAWTGKARAGLSFNGTTAEQIEAINALRAYVASNSSTLGLSAEQTVAFTSELDRLLGELNSEAYQESQKLVEQAKLYQDFLDGTISRQEYLNKLLGIQEKTEKTFTNNIQEATDYYDDLIAKLEELRDLQKESTEWEEKKLAVLEAEQALESARNEATVRRFNEATGQWEWQTDEKKIDEAEKNLEKARLNLEESAYNTIIDQLKDQTATNDSILKIIEEVAPLLGQDFANAVKSAISSTTSVDLDKPIVSADGSYDSGGIANGLGFMPKATAQPETVNDPELTAKILSPVSNAEFSRYVKDMGIMFETARRYSQSPVIERIGGATDNRIDNSGQITMNGVTIGSNARNNTLDELLTLANIVSNT